MKQTVRTKKPRSLNRRIFTIPIVVMAPMLCVVICLQVVMMHSVEQYNEITESVTYANHYSKEFKERMDYSMYLAVIGNKTAEELGDGKTRINGIKTVNPYTYIEEMETACDEMSEIATASINRNQIQYVKNSLKSLRNRVKTLEEMIANGSSYDDKMKYLDENIRGESGLTAVIQEAVQAYSYEEIKNFVTAREELKYQTEMILRMSILVIIGAMVLAVIMSAHAVRSVTGPIQKLCSQTRRVASGDFSAKTDVDTEDEIAVLTDSFNEMTAEIGSLVYDIKQQEKSRRIAEMRLLQAQINPHFLYNTLDTIVWLAEEKKTDEVVSIVTTLSAFFRTTLSKGKDYITIKEEKSHIESYLKIQQIRYQDIMEYEIDIPSELDEYRIPKLTLQPLVENALYHGIKQKRGGGKVQISGKLEGEKIILSVTDNGQGMSEKQFRELKDRLEQGTGAEGTGGFGLLNVNQRLQYYYGKEYGLRFESEEGKGTVAQAWISTKKIPPF